MAQNAPWGNCPMRALGAAAHAAWSFVDFAQIKRALALTATVIATTAIVLLAAFVAVAIGLT
jgi:hypothetical protein